MYCEGCNQCGSRGNPSAPILIVGMAPGIEELEEGKPFVGRSGKLLWRAFYEAGLDPEKCYVMNVINCYPELDGGKKISPAQWLRCSQRFADEVSTLDAHIVLALGADALLRTTGIKGEITKWRGHLIKPEECINPIKVKGGTFTPALPPNCELIIPSLHPSYIMRQGLKPVPFLWSDVDRVNRALKGDLEPVVTTSGGEWIPGPRCVDLETEGFTDVVTLVGVAGPTRAGLAARTWAWPPPPNIIDELQDAPLLVGHNLSFDILLMRKQGISLNNRLWDTMWAGHKVQPDLPKNLDTMSSLYLDCPRFKSLPTTNPERPRMDALHTLAMVKPQRQALDDLNQLDTFNLEMDCLPILIDMTWSGVRVDPTVRDRLAAGLQLSLEENRAAWEKLAPGVNPGSPVQLKKLLYDQWGMKRQYKEKKLTTEKSALIKLLRTATPSQREAINTLIKVRETSKLLSTYFSRDTETIHPSYFPVQKDDATYGTATGRLSSQDPNIQNVPKHLRSMFIPHTPGNVFVVGDWAQIEAWIAATISGDQALLEAIRGDIHTYNAKLFKCDRTRAKNFYYGTTYGAGPGKIYETMLGKGFEVQYSEISRMMKLFKSGYPRLMQWRIDVVDEVRRRGYAENRFGRRRYFYDPSDSAPEIWAFHPSSNAADILWRIMRSVNDLAMWAGGYPPTLFCHDEVVIESTPAHAAKCADELRGIMEQPWDVIAPGFRVPTKITQGTSWGGAE